MIPMEVFTRGTQSVGRTHTRRDAARICFPIELGSALRCVGACGGGYSCPLLNILGTGLRAALLQPWE